MARTDARRGGRTYRPSGGRRRFRLHEQGEPCCKSPREQIGIAGGKGGTQGAEPYPSGKAEGTGENAGRRPHGRHAEEASRPAVSFPRAPYASYPDEGLTILGTFAHSPASIF